jgi:hypothetical protein
MRPALVEPEVFGQVADRLPRGTDRRPRHKVEAEKA